ncbi:MAG: hypothetical protein CSA75_00215 [Sorangium cellulosum]|nr:MAG: hypothetical protein CSA75_00215 [Sorangium cellulosum]
MASTFRIAHQAFLLIRGKVAAAGTPMQLANEAKNKISHDFIVASGVAYQSISRPNPIEISSQSPNSVPSSKPRSG